MKSESIPSRFVIQNTTIWSPNEVKEGMDVVVRDGVIQEIAKTGQNFQDSVILKPTNGLLMPLGVDAQAHLRVPGQPQKEIAMTGLKAALRGGYGALLTMPNTNPVIDSPEVCDLAARELRLPQEKTGVHVYLSAAMTMGQAGARAVDGQALQKWGVKALTDDGKGLASDQVMNQLFEISEQTGLPLLQHAEMPGHGGVLAPGPVQEKLGVKPYFADPEFEMVKRDIALLKKHKRAHYHVLHISSLKTVELVDQAKKEGLNITCEVCPHHLLFTVDDISESDSSYKMNPPLRSKEDRAVLQQALDAGVIDFVSTDHAPHEPAMKTTNFAAAAFGTTGLETALRVLLKLNHDGKLSEKRVVECFSHKPAVFLKIQSQIGEIKKGQKLKGVLVEEKQKAFKVSVSDLESLSKNNCFVGHRLPGKINYTFNEKGVFNFTSLPLSRQATDL